MLGHLSIYRGLFASEIHIRSLAKSATKAVGMATTRWSIGCWNYLQFFVPVFFKWPAKVCSLLLLKDKMIFFCISREFTSCFFFSFDIYVHSVNFYRIKYGSYKVNRRPSRYIFFSAKICTAQLVYRQILHYEFLYQ